MSSVLLEIGTPCFNCLTLVCRWWIVPESLKLKIRHVTRQFLGCVTVRNAWTRGMLTPDYLRKTL